MRKILISIGQENFNSSCGENSNMDTKRIQEAINICHEAGGGCVVLEKGDYITGTICLHSYVTIFLKKGARILGSEEIGDYPDNETCFVDAVGHKRGKALIYAYRASHIGLAGEGIVDGRGDAFPPEHPAHLIRPFLVRLVECEDVTVKGIAMMQSAAWCLHIQDSSRVVVEQVSIRNRCNGNNDGIDIDGCSDVVIDGCKVDSGDDAICLKATSRRSCQNIHVNNCTVTTRWAGFKIGTESVGDFYNIEVGNCRFRDVEGCGIKIVPVDGGNLENLWIHDIEMQRCTGPIFFSTGRRLRRYFQTGRDSFSQIRHVVLERIKAHVIPAEGGFLEGKPWGNAKGCVVFSGLKELPIEDIQIRDCCFDMPGGVSEMPSGCVPEMETQYPEFHLFDVLPGWGMYFRYVRKLKVDGVEMYQREKDVRPMTVREDVDDVSIR